MFARIAWIEFQAGKAEQGFRALERSVVPPIKERQGYRGVIVLRDRKTSTAGLLTLWDTEADMQVDAGENYPSQADVLHDVLAGAATREFYEVNSISIEQA